MNPRTGSVYVSDVLAEARYITEHESESWPVEFHADTQDPTNIGVAWRHVGAPPGQGDSGPVGPAALYESDIYRALHAIATDGLAVAW